MRNKRADSTVWVLVALIVVCCGSFIGVRALNKDVQPTLPVIVTNLNAAVTNNYTNDFTQATEFSIPEILSTESEEEEIEEEAEAQDEEEITKLNQFTTFSGAANTTTTTQAQTETETEAGGLAAVLPNFEIPSLNPNADSNELVQTAAVFSNGFLSFMYNPEGRYYYTVSDPWQRQFGFNELYDLGASFAIFYYDTLRCKFRYDDKDWMIQLWKGQYGFVFVGGEIGVYNKPLDRSIEHYDAASDEDSLYMSMTFYRKGEEVFSRDYDRYWWCTGFVPGQLDNFTDRTELSLRAKITMKDQKMLKAFLASLEENGLERNEDFTVNNLDVYIVW